MHLLGYIHRVVGMHSVDRHVTESASPPGCHTGDEVLIYIVT
jgi:hypothetical protein